MVGPPQFFSDDSGLQVYEYFRLGPDKSNQLLYKMLGPEKIQVIDTYLSNFDTYYFKEGLRERIKKDFLYFTKHLVKIDVKNFFVSSFLFRVGLYKLTDITVYGSSLYNPILTMDYELPILLFRYHEAKVFKYTGLSFDGFFSLTKEEQETMFNTLINIEILDKTKMSEIVDELDLEKD